MPRPCFCDRLDCHLCQLYQHNSMARAVWDRPPTRACVHMGRRLRDGRGEVLTVVKPVG